MWNTGPVRSLADTLSRTPINNESNELQEEEFEVNMSQVLPMSEMKFDKFKQVTQNDPSWQQFGESNSTQMTKGNIEPVLSIKTYWDWRYEIAAVDGIVHKEHPVITQYRHEVRNAKCFSETESCGLLRGEKGCEGPRSECHHQRKAWCLPYIQQPCWGNSDMTWGCDYSRSTFGVGLTDGSCELSAKILFLLARNWPRNTLQASASFCGDCKGLRAKCRLLLGWCAQEALWWQWEHDRAYILKINEIFH